MYSCIVLTQSIQAQSHLILHASSRSLGLFASCMNLIYHFKKLHNKFRYSIFFASLHIHSCMLYTSCHRYKCIDKHSMWLHNLLIRQYLIVCRYPVANTHCKYLAAASCSIWFCMLSNKPPYNCDTSSLCRNVFWLCAMYMYIPLELGSDS